MFSNETESSDAPGHCCFGPLCRHSHAAHDRGILPALELGLCSRETGAGGLPAVPTRGALLAGAIVRAAAARLRARGTAPGATPPSRCWRHRNAASRAQLHGMQAISAGPRPHRGANPVLSPCSPAGLLGERMTGERQRSSARGRRRRLHRRASHHWRHRQPGRYRLRLRGGVDGGRTILFKKLAPNGGLWISNGIQNLAGGPRLCLRLRPQSIGDVVLSWPLGRARLSGAACSAVRLLPSSISDSADARQRARITPDAAARHDVGWLRSASTSRSDLFGILPVALGICLVTRPTNP